MKTLIILTLLLLSLGLLAAQTLAEEIDNICAKGSFYELGGAKYFIWSGADAADSTAVANVAYSAIMFAPIVENWFDDVDETENVDLVRQLNYVGAEVYAEGENYFFVFPISEIAANFTLDYLMSDYEAAFQDVVKLVYDKAERVPNSLFFKE